jgi:two-component system cell cycle sensor histidine kinase/response regulator CckA
MKVLVADDDLQSQYFLVRLLTGSGFDVVTVRHGAEALEVLKDGPVDLIVTDLLMPKVDGFQLCHAVRTDPRLRHIPVLVYTATYTQPGDETLARRAGADAFLLKPTEPVDILRTVRALLDRPTERVPVATSEIDYLRKHDERLVLKLTRKVEQLHQADEQLVEREARYHTLAECAPVGILSLDANASPEYWNARWARITGAEPDRSAPLAWTTAARGEDRKRLRGLWEIVSQTGEEERGEFSLGPDPGCWVLLQIRALVGEASRPKGYLVMITDITKEKQLQQERAELSERLNQRQKLESLGTLVSGITHEFGNLLIPILGYTEFIRNTPELPEKVQQQAGFILEAAMAGRALTRQILTFARQQDDEFQIFNPAIAVRTSLKLLRPVLPPGVELRENVSDDVQDIVGAEAQIQQLVVNLTKNAVDALGLDPGRVEVTVADVHLAARVLPGQPDFPAGDYVLIGVRDTGPGIPPSVLPKIFDPFFTTKQVGEGTGLGLSVVHGIVEKHRGTILVESRDGEGASFRIYLPVAGASEETTAPCPA